MHLLAATPGSVTDEDEAVDLDQSPGDIVLLTVADSDLACFARAAEMLRTGEGGRPSVRLVNLLQLKHPYSVDLYVEKVIAKARFVAVALIGDKSYWPYGIDEIEKVARERDIAFAALSIGRETDAALTTASTLKPEFVEQLAQYLRQGGIANAVGFLCAAARSVDCDLGRPDSPVPLADAGLYSSNIDRPTLAEVRAQWKPDRPVALFAFYRALFAAGTMEAVDAVIERLQSQGLNVLPVHVRSLRAPFAVDLLSELIESVSPDVVLNATSFAASQPGNDRTPAVLESANCPILQLSFASMREEQWAASAQGLGARDLAMSVALPEIDGRVFTRAVAFKTSARFDPRTECGVVVPKVVQDRVAYVARLAANWAKLRQTPALKRKVALVLANYPNRDGRIGNGVGLDTPSSAATILTALGEAGYEIADAPRSGKALMDTLLSGVTNDLSSLDSDAETLPLPTYHEAFDLLPMEVRDAVRERWGEAEDDPFVEGGAFRLAVHHFGNVAIGVQPARGYNVDPKETYHDPALVPPHAYLAFHFWLEQAFGAQAVIHTGKHGNLEWLPGKALALSETCLPEVCSGPIPQLYPFIVNDPGEGTQAKRRIGAVIVDHLTPPLTRAESYGPLKQLEALVDEYYLAAGMDPRRIERLRREIIDVARGQGLDVDAGMVGDGEDALAALDNYLCELKELQIRDGLHVFGHSPEGSLRRDLLIALARVPRGFDDPGDASLLRALADDLKLSFDPLDCIMGEEWTSARPGQLADLTKQAWRTIGDTVERLELLAIALLDGHASPPGERSAAVLQTIQASLAPRVDDCGASELAALLRGLDGRFVVPGPSGAPTRGRPDVLPTGRNFYSVDTRAVPTAVAWDLGQRSAALLVEDYLQREGEYPKAMAVSAWGTANMRTGGDDIAQALALMGVRPKWEWSSGRVVGFEVIPLAELGRPRIDVTFRVSGFFRDAFPDQIELIDRAARAIQALEEDETDNPAAAQTRRDEASQIEAGIDAKRAALRAGARVFGSKPGAYGAGLQAMIDERLWGSREDLADAYLEWGGYTYGGGADGTPERELFAERLGAVDAVVQNQDNREHDLLDSDDYYQFEGGIAAAAEAISGKAPISYHNDHSRPERPVVRTLSDEIARIVRARVTNPKWIAGVMRHGYKGAFEIAASVDYLFAFAATTDAVKDHHFDAVHTAFIEDETVRDFMVEANPAAFRETAGRLAEALERGLWKPKSNSARDLLAEIAGGHNGKADR
ncbi:MAG: cobaltochelatase subunit CobN [Pseudomonadota bacterium]